ncbi:hypothetical protein [Dictyobacter arantiisoli]|uniref:Uncharacterized protein n=1 Tax=Dictyobacter arantiisoli TaxID=2014874 RepID=A0A5A5TCB0_9CHLR|nr:hypothetical protein [Dictyobacter arantiisoli]GCF08649.1 hypothetical protein KDI_22130 [Dictyobacter arantiisoli]
MSNNFPPDPDATRRRQDNPYDDQRTVPFAHDDASASVSPYAQPTIPFSPDMHNPYAPIPLHSNETVSMDAMYQNAPQASYLPSADMSAAAPATPGIIPAGAVSSGVMPSGALPGGTIPTSKKPARKRLLIASIAIIVILVLGIGGAVLLSAVTANANNQGTAATTPAADTTPVATAKVANKSITTYLTRYRATIRDQIAQDLHLTPTQLETQLGAGRSLSAIATGQGISATQLQASVSRAFEKSFQPALGSGALTQKQITALIKRMLKQPQTLDRLLMAPAKKATTKTV